MTIGKSRLTYFIGETVSEGNESVKENVSLARRHSIGCLQERKENPCNSGRGVSR